jgi:hypothetical protein
MERMFQFRISHLIELTVLGALSSFLAIILEPSEAIWQLFWAGFLFFICVTGYIGINLALGPPSRS